MNLVSKVFSKALRISNEQIAGSFMDGLLSRNIKGNFILMYHGVTATGSTRFNLRHTSVQCFSKQINFLKKHCSLISVSDFFESRFQPGKPNLAITFDDGYLNNFIYAKPVLEEFKCPATFFITGLNEVDDNILWADYVNIATALTDADIEIEGEHFIKKGGQYLSQPQGRSLYDIIKHQKAGYSYKQKIKDAFGKHISFQNDPSIMEYWQLMDDRQISETSRSPYITIGSHGYYHNNLGAITHENALDELQRSKKYLEKLTQYEIHQLAYPDGSYTSLLLRAAGKMGFNIQLAADHFLFNELPNNPLIKKRYGIYSADTCINQLFAAVRGKG